MSSRWGIRHGGSNSPPIANLWLPHPFQLDGRITPREGDSTLRNSLHLVSVTGPQKCARPAFACMTLTIFALCACAQPAPRAVRVPEALYDELSCDQLRKEAKRRLREANRSEYLIEHDVRGNFKAEVSAIKRAMLNKGC